MLVWWWLVASSQMYEMRCNLLELDITKVD